MSRVEMELSRDEARWLAVIATGLDRRPFRRKATAPEILATIRKLGSVQLDTISVISRSHETVLWSRLGSYDPALISDLFDPGLALTEYLAHAAAIIPIEDLALFRTHMERARRETDHWASDPSFRPVMDQVLRHIDVEGPAASRHFERVDDGRKAAQWEWWGLKPERRALNGLWWRGEVVLRQRDKSFSRIFDLTERVIPGFWEGEAMPDEARNLIFLRRAMSALGVSTVRWAADYYRTGGPFHIPITKARDLLAGMERAGEIIPVTVPGIDEPTWIDPALAGTVDELRNGRLRPSLTTFLSPFDNLVWNRDRCAQLFDFEYRLECYTPAPKRKYGYYNMPILYRGKVIGRLDPSYNRKARLLTINSLHLEPWVRPSAAMAAAIVNAIEDLVRFLGGPPGAWVLPSTNPPQILPMIQQAGAGVVGHGAAIAQDVPGFDIAAE